MSLEVVDKIILFGIASSIMSIPVLVVGVGAAKLLGH